ncbi:SDR family oxidoreductase [Sneathiella marina]|uniref:SDR family oxidoreductase n=1 Tax=Sneathiella marina TaxID=2950108 RepID=A0ABY4W2D8_9PROT|nr:SDR family oxidoreductase [Sneathiella marina]USG61318.1 SDR family oxidoreductase [Sneathiella marina]
MSKKVILVTGAGSGIGRALSIGFANDKFTVIGVGRDAENLKGTKAIALDGQFDYYAADIADFTAMSQIVNEIIDRHDSLDILINNAAVYPKQRFLDTTPEEWASTININLNAMANCCRLVLPGMLEKEYGRIINVGSLADLNPIVMSAAYSTSKGAVHVLTRAIAREIDTLNKPNVLINEFLPDKTESAMSDVGGAPDKAYLPVKKLIDRPSGSPSGRSYSSGREVLPNLGLKILLKHAFSEKITALTKGR